MSKLNDSGLNLIKSFESFRSNPYPDPISKGKPYTIGYGSTLYEDGREVTLHDTPITEPQATDLLKNTLKKLEDQVSKLITAKCTDNQFSACVSLAYNIGIGNFQHSTVLRCMNAFNYNDAADSFLLWNKVNKVEVPGLTRRRQAERSLFLTA